MKVKKIALLGLASIVTMGMGVSMAGGPARSSSGIYIGADIGGFFNHTYGIKAANVSGTEPANFGTVHFTSVSNVADTNVPSGLTAGGVLGYRFDRTWSLQFGYAWEQEQTLNVTGVGTVSDGGTTTITSQSAHLQLDAYSLYLAARADVHMFGRFGAYFMVGPAWTSLKQKATFVTTTSGNHTKTENFVSPVGAAAITYNASRAMQFNLQYMYISSYMGDKKQDKLRDHYQGTQRLTVGGTYFFAL